MRPRERRETSEQDLFRSRLDQIIDMKHALVKLARAIDWGFLEQTFGAVYTDKPGQPPLPTRLMAGLAILKHTYDLSDIVAELQKRTTDIEPRILLTGLPSLAWSHRKSPAASARAGRIAACDSRESSKLICKEITLQWPKTGKFDYLSGPNHLAHSIALEFFTDD